MNIHYKNTMVSAMVNLTCEWNFCSPTGVGTLCYITHTSHSDSREISPLTWCHAFHMPTYKNLCFVYWAHSMLQADTEVFRLVVNENLKRFTHAQKHLLFFMHCDHKSPITNQKTIKSCPLMSHRCYTVCDLESTTHEKEMGNLYIR